MTPTGVRRRGRLALLALPIAPLQGVWLTRTIARYADAHGRIGTVGTGPGRRTVVALGDSVTAGYAVPHHRASVAGQLAARLSARENATVTWRVCAKSGATAYDALGLVDEPALADADLFFVSVGVNDLKHGHGAALSSRSGRLARHGSRGGAGGARVCLLGIPPLDQFPAFPRPLADVLGWRGRAFDAIAAEELARRPRTLRIETREPLGPEMFGPDGFHPSEALHAAFADAVMRELARLGGR